MSMLGPVALIVGAIGAGVSAYSSIQSAKAQNKALKEQQRLQKMADLRARRKMAREAAIARGAVINMSSQIGGGQGEKGLGSSVLSGLSNISSQLSSGFGWQQTSQTSALKQQAYLNRASNWDTWANISGNVSNFATNLYGTTARG